MVFLRMIDSPVFNSLPNKGCKCDLKSHQDSETVNDGHGLGELSHLLAEGVFHQFTVGVDVEFESEFHQNMNVIVGDKAA